MNITWGLRGMTLELTLLDRFGTSHEQWTIVADRIEDTKSVAGILSCRE